MNVYLWMCFKKCYQGGYLAIAKKVFICKSYFKNGRLFSTWWRKDIFSLLDASFWCWQQSYPSYSNATRWHKISFCGTRQIKTMMGYSLNLQLCWILNQSKHLFFNPQAGLKLSLCKRLRLNIKNKVLTKAGQINSKNL